MQAEFTYENNGKSRQTGIKVGYYMSTNPWISTRDRKIGTAVYELGRDVVYTQKTRIKLPEDLKSNTAYWLGVIIDEDDAISEAVEWNNATYTAIWIK